MTRVIITIIIWFNIIGCGPTPLLPPKLKQYENVQKHCIQLDDGSIVLNQSIKDHCIKVIDKLDNAHSTHLELVEHKLDLNTQVKITRRYTKERNQVKQEYQEFLVSLNSILKDSMEKDDLQTFTTALKFSNKPLKLKQYLYMRSKSPLFNTNTKYVQYEKKNIEVLLEKGKIYMENGNTPKGLKYINLSADMGNIEAMKIIVKYYQKASSILEDKRIIEFYNKLCQNNDYESCFYLSAYYNTGIEVTKDSKKAIFLLDNACSHNIGKACAKRGNQIFLKDKSNALVLYKKACDIESAEQCSQYSQAYYQHNALPEKQFSLQILEYACELGNIESCISIAKEHYKGSIVDSNRTKALSYYKQACEKNGIDDCKEYLDIDILTEQQYDTPFIIDLTSLACGKGHLESCIKGSNLLENEALSKVRSKQKIYFDTTACTLNDSQSCYTSGKYYYDQKAYADAYNYFELGCAAKNASSCSVLAKIFSKGYGLKRDNVQAIKYQKASCEYGGKEDCIQLAQTFEKNYSWRSTLYYYAMACTKGSNIGCIRHKRTEKKLQKIINANRKKEKQQVFQKSEDLIAFESIHCSSMGFKIINRLRARRYYASGTFLFRGDYVDRAIIQMRTTEFTQTGYKIVFAKDTGYTNHMTTEDGFEFNAPVYKECNENRYKYLRDKTEQERGDRYRAEQGILPSDYREWQSVGVSNTTKILSLIEKGITPDTYEDYIQQPVKTTYIPYTDNTDKWHQVGVYSKRDIKRLKALDIDWDDYLKWKKVGVRNIYSIEKYANKGLYPSLYKTLKDKRKLNKFLRTGRY